MRMCAIALALTALGCSRGHAQPAPHHEASRFPPFPARARGGPGESFGRQWFTGDAELNSYVWLSRITTLYYFAYFLVVMPVLGLVEKPRPVPETISSPVLGDSDKKD